jgi:hypothetical protein
MALRPQGSERGAFEGRAGHYRNHRRADEVSLGGHDETKLKLLRR